MIVAIESRNGICTTCGGKIHRYPNPNPASTDGWAHLDRADWIDNPHPISPQAAE